MSRLTRLLAAAIGVGCLALGACGSAETPNPGAPAAQQARVIKHKYGETTITGQPQRVVTVGLTEQDAVLALGVIPAGVLGATIGLDAIALVLFAIGILGALFTALTWRRVPRPSTPSSHSGRQQPASQ